MMRSTKVWARTWPGARREPLLVNMRTMVRLPSAATAICQAPGCCKRAAFEVDVMRSDTTQFKRFVCGSLADHARATRGAA